MSTGTNTKSTSFSSAAARARMVAVECALPWIFIAIAIAKLVFESANSRGTNWEKLTRQIKEGKGIVSGFWER